MQFIASILAVAAVAYAVAIPDDSSPVGAATGSTCASGSQVACCTTDSSNSDLLGNVLGGSCMLNNLSLLSSLNGNCPAGNTYCCPSNQDGTFNVNAQCNPITS